MDPAPIASRWLRLEAYIVDALILTAIVLPVVYLTGGFSKMSTGAKLPSTYGLLIQVFGILVFLILNGKLLANQGQTIGKKVAGIKIVDTNGNLPTVKNHLVLRYAMFFLPGYIPGVGYLITLIDFGFIFGKSRRCIHDYLAETWVIKC